MIEQIAAQHGFKATARVGLEKDASELDVLFSDDFHKRVSAFKVLRSNGLSFIVKPAMFNVCGAVYKKFRIGIDRISLTTGITVRVRISALKGHQNNHGVQCADERELVSEINKAKKMIDSLSTLIGDSAVLMDKANELLQKNLKISDVIEDIELAKSNLVGAHIIIDNGLGLIEKYRIVVPRKNAEHLAELLKSDVKALIAKHGVKL